MIGLFALNCSSASSPVGRMANPAVKTAHLPSRRHTELVGPGAGPGVGPPAEPDEAAAVNGVAQNSSLKIPYPYLTTSPTLEYQ